MSKLSVDKLINKEFKPYELYSVDDIFKIFANHYNIGVNKFKFFNYDKKEVSNKLSKIALNGKNATNINIISFNGDIVSKLFIQIKNEIELIDKKEKITKEEYLILVNKNKERIAKIIKNCKFKSGFLIDESDILEIISAIFPSGAGYYFYDGGKETISNILKNNINSSYDKKRNKFIISEKDIFELIDILYGTIELQKESYYTINDVIERLKYPARLENYYLRAPWIYYSNNMWIKYDKTHIQKIIMGDYTVDQEFTKIGDWRIYGPDSKYKDNNGIHRIMNDREIRDDYGYNSGKEKYLMNATYCRHLLIELENRKSKVGYKFSLLDLEKNLSNFSKKEIVDYSNKFLKEINGYYKEEIQSIIKDNNNKINYYNALINDINECERMGVLSKIDKVSELKKKIDKLQKIKFKNQNSDNIITGIKDLIKNNNLDKGDIKKCAKRLYNKQIKNYKNVDKIARKSYQIQGECNKIVEEINKEILEIRSILNEKDLRIFEDIGINILIEE